MAVSKRGLTDAAVRKAKPRGAAYNLYDTKGLYVTVSPSGAKWWRMKYRYASRERRIGLGAYPEVSLADARAKCENARAVIREGRDPGVERRAERRRLATDAARTFGHVADAWLADGRPALAESSYAKNRWLIEQVRDELGSRAIGEINAPDVLAALDKIKARGRYETARRARQCVGQVFSYAIERHLAIRNPVADLARKASPVRPRPRSAITRPDEVGKLLRALDSFVGYPTTHAALRLAPLVFVRPGELRHAEWAEFDLENAEWRIPAQKMKMREEHLVPLAPQALSILRDLMPLTERSRYCFPSIRTHDRPMSENTINAALRGLGFDKDTMTGHGFRAMASTLLNELGWPPDVIERQLAHAERNKVRAVYNRAKYLAERREMMKAWANYLEELKSGVECVAATSRPPQVSRLA